MVHPRSTLARLSLNLAGWLAAVSASADGLVAIRQESTLAAPKVATAPAIDGVLNDAAWAKAQPLREWGFNNQASQYQSEAWICGDDTHLYLATRCHDDNLKGLVTAFEGAGLWKNDCVELFIVPDKKPGFYTHLILTCDGKSNGGQAWVADEWGEPTPGKALAIACKAGRETNAWTLEVAIPLAGFGVTVTEASRWAIGVNREKQSGPSEVSSFQGGFHDVAHYPDLLFGTAAIVVDGVGVKNIGNEALQVVAALKGDKAGKELELTVKPGESVPFDWQTILTPAAGSAFTVDVKDKAGKLLVHEAYLVGQTKTKAAPIDVSKIPPGTFTKSVLDDPAFFPIAVWLQPAGMASRYQEIGVNLFVAGSDSYPAPRDRAFLDEIAKFGMHAICTFDEKAVAEKLYEHPAFIGWHTTDEPELTNQATGTMFFTPEEMLASFAKIRSADATHPAFLNLGCGVAHERFTGGVASDEQYRKYAAACDILCFDVYPCNSLGADGPNRLYMVAKGIDRLRKWGGPNKRVWAWIEANKFTGAEQKDSRSPTPQEVKSEIWMALVHGANGYGFFCHSFAPPMKVSGITPEMMQALKTINAEVKSLAPVLNSPTVANAVKVEADTDGRVDVMVKKVAGATYLFAINMRPRPLQARLTVAKVGETTATVLFENRKVELKSGIFSDSFGPFAVHAYQISE